MSKYGYLLFFYFGQTHFQIWFSYIDVYHEQGAQDLAGSFEVILYNTGKIIFIYELLGNLTTYECGLNKGDGSLANSYSGFSDPTTDFAIRFAKPSSGGVGGSSDDDDLDDTASAAPIIAGIIIIIVIGSVAGVSAF